MEPFTATAPLWVKMHGGVGFFDSNGIARPNAQRMDEESSAELLTHSSVGLMSIVKGAGYRILVTSMRGHDLYTGCNNTDPNNPRPQQSEYHPRRRAEAHHWP